MEAPLCRLCHKRHWGNCTGVTPSHGEERAETDPSILTRKVDEKPPPRRRQLVPGGLGAPVPASVRSATHHIARKATPITLASVTENPPSVTEKQAPISVTASLSVTEPRRKKGRPKSGKPKLTPAEKQRAYRARKSKKQHP